MSKAFTREDTEGEDDDLPPGVQALPVGARNYVTPAGFEKLRAEHERLLREIDRRVRFLTKRLENAEVVDPLKQTRREQVFFGATVTYADARGRERTVSIVGADEVDLDRGRVSWISPIARALLKAELGDEVRLQTPHGPETIEVVAIRYVALGP